ncbi:helix-turn-helix domain-containing protein [Brachybacterium sp. DNPG3]
MATLSTADAPAPAAAPVPAAAPLPTEAPAPTVAPGRAESSTRTETPTGARWGVSTLYARRHPEADLVLWCRSGEATVCLGPADAPLHAGTGELVPTVLSPGRALFVPRGRPHAIRVAPGGVLHPVLLPVDESDRAPALVGDLREHPVGRVRERPVDRALGAALLALSVAAITELRPAVSRLAALQEAVRSQLHETPADLSTPPVAHIDRVVNEDENVLVMAAFGAVTVMLRSPDGPTMPVELPEHMALDIPPGVEHRIVTRGHGIALPVFHAGAASAAFDAAVDPTRAYLCYLPEDVRMLAEAHLVATSTALRPDAWDPIALPRALAGLVQRACVMHVDGSRPADVELLREQVIRDPAGAWSPATWSRLTAPSGADVPATAAAARRRALERAFRRTAGTSFVPWRNTVRAEQAVDLLAEGAPVKAVARHVGFAHASGFSRAFAAVMGRPPTAVAVR